MSLRLVILVSFVVGGVSGAGSSALLLSISGNVEAFTESGRAQEIPAAHLQRVKVGSRENPEFGLESASVLRGGNELLAADGGLDLEAEGAVGSVVASGDDPLGDGASMTNREPIQLGVFLDVLEDAERDPPREPFSKGQPLDI